MNIKELKCDRGPFWDVWNGKKRNEVRYNDRRYQVGDLLLLRETTFTSAAMKTDATAYPLQYTGREILSKVTHILRDNEISGALREDWVILSIDVLHKI